MATEPYRVDEPSSRALLGRAAAAAAHPLPRVDTFADPPRARRRAVAPGTPRRSWPLLTVFALMVALQLLVAAISIDLLSAVRAYVGGESLYSKGQKDAQIYLIDYAEFHREEDYQRFLAALGVPLGDRAAREALQQRVPDLEKARQGFLAGGNHPDDIDGLIRLFRWFHRVPFMAKAIETWTAGDRIIEQMLTLAGQAHARIVAGDRRAPEVVQMREKAPLLNEQLTQLENAFSAQLGVASRLTQRLLLGVNLGLALLLGLTGSLFVRRSARVQSATEDEVRRRQESLQRLMDSAAEGLYGVDTEGRCTFINRAALRMLGYDDESELVGRDIHSLIHRSRSDGSPYPASESRIMRSYRERRELHVTEDVLWRRDGGSFPVEYWSHPILQGGQVQGAVATFFDISERQKMQAALRQGEVRIAGLVDAVNDGVITIDDAERIVLFNRGAERLFGVSADEAIGRTIERFLPRRNGDGGPAGQLRLSFADIDAQPAGSVEEVKGIRADGSNFPLEASVSILATDQGTLRTIVLRDVTELHLARAERQAREALEAASRAKTEFLSRMSHELRTPLNAVIGFSQLLRLDASRPPSLEQLERIQHIENAGAHLLALVNDVLDLSRVESGQMVMTLEPVCLRTACEDALIMVSSFAADAEVAVQLLGDRSEGEPPELPSPDEAWVLADRVRLRQVLVNLLSNAVKYNRRGGEVGIEWERTDGTVVMRIVDTGVGMTPDKVERLFEPFNRLGAEKSSVEGTGIGLVLSRRLAEMMEGGLAIESEVGQGTIATVVLRTTQATSSTLAAASPPSQHGEFDPGLRVLYAEDNEVNVELVRQVASLRPSVSLAVATDGGSALAMALREPPDLMLIDMNLGDMTGLELAAALQDHPATAAVRLVALSADALPEQISAALAAGFESYLTKPIDFRQLLNVFDGKDEG